MQYGIKYKYNTTGFEYLLKREMNAASKSNLITFELK